MGIDMLEDTGGKWGWYWRWVWTVRYYKERLAAMAAWYRDSLLEAHEAGYDEAAQTFKLGLEQAVRACWDQLLSHGCRTGQAVGWISKIDLYPKHLELEVMVRLRNNRHQCHERMGALPDDFNPTMGGPFIINISSDEILQAAESVYRRYAGAEIRALTEGNVRKGGLNRPPSIPPPEPPRGQGGQAETPPNLRLDGDQCLLPNASVLKQ